MYENGVVYLIKGKCNQCGFKFKNQTVVYQELTQIDAEIVVRTMHSFTGCNGTIQASIKRDILFEKMIGLIARLIS